MGAQRVEYQIVGRYMSGKEVTAYHLQSISTGKGGRYTREQVAYLVGREQITNCIAQIYKDKLLLRGKGINLDDLPVKQERKDIDPQEHRSEADGRTQTMGKLLLVKAIKSGRNTVGYVVQNDGCGAKRFKRQQVIELAKAGKIANARVQNYNGKELLRGFGCNLDQLPAEIIGEQHNGSQEEQDGSTQKQNDMRKVVYLEEQ